VFLSAGPKRHVRLCRAAKRALCLLSLSVFCRTHAARAVDTQACIDAHLQAQIAHGKQHLREAEELFTTCGSEGCPGVIRAECAESLARIKSEIPTVVIAVKDVQGRDVSLYDLSLNGEHYPPTAVGIELNPGSYSLHVSASGYYDRDYQFQAREGEQLRRIELKIERVPPPRRTIWPGIVLVGVSGTALVTAGALGLSARHSERGLEACAPTCDHGSVEAVRNRYLATNITLGVAGASAIAAGVWWLWFGPRKDQPHEPEVAVGLGGPDPGVQLFGSF
jgi:hypothetical protein